MNTVEYLISISARGNSELSEHMHDVLDRYAFKIERITSSIDKDSGPITDRD